MQKQSIIQMSNNQKVKCTSNVHIPYKNKYWNSTYILCETAEKNILAFAWVTISLNKPALPPGKKSHHVH